MVIPVAFALRHLAANPFKCAEVFVKVLKHLAIAIVAPFDFTEDVVGA